MLSETSRLDFSDKSVLVVGGSSGIGRGIARAFHARGAEVAVWGTRASVGDYGTPEELDGIDYAQVDVTDERQVRAASAPSKLDVLVLSQGTVRYGRKEFSVEDFRTVVDVNLKREMASGLIEELQDQGVSVVVVSGYALPPVSVDKAAAFLQKPFSGTELLTTLRRVVAQTRIH